MATGADLGGHIYNWLQKVGYPVRPFGVSYGIAPGASADAADAWAQPGQIVINPKMQQATESVAARLGTRGRLTPAQLRALNVLMHEGLHQMRYGRTPEFYRQKAQVGSAEGYEEAATSAAQEDLMPIFAAKMFGHKMPGAKSPYREQNGYDDMLTNLRQLSVFGSGAKKFTDYNARVWRRSFLHATPERRQELANEATQARIAWGQTTGRDKPKYAQPKPKPKPKPNQGRLVKGRPVPGRPGQVDYT